MGAFGMLTTGTVTTSVPIPEVQTLDLGDIAAADTFKLTFNAVETGAVTYSADMIADITAALEGHADIAVGDVVVTKTSTSVYVVTFGGALAGANVGALTITSASGFTPVGVTETTSGRSQSTTVVTSGSRFGVLYAVRWGLFVNGATNELLITDAGGRTLYSVTGKDTNVSGALLRTAVGSDGRDQGYNAAANVLPTFFEGPLTVRVRNQAGTVSPASGAVELFVKNGISEQLVKRSTGTLASATGSASQEMSMGSTFGRPIHAEIEGFDSSTDYAITDVNGANVFTKTALDATTALDFALGWDGEDQAGNAAADTLPNVFRGPLTVAVTNGGTATTGHVTLWCLI